MHKRDILWGIKGGKLALRKSEGGEKNTILGRAKIRDKNCLIP